MPLTLQSGSPALPITSAATWNRTWIKPKATLWASASNEADTVPMIARWQFGSGTVVAAAMQSPPSLGSALADVTARPPRDPRFAVTWTTDETLMASVQAIENKTYLNSLPLVLQLIHQDGSTPTVEEHPLQQTAPGRYDISLPAPRTPVFAILRLRDNIVDRMPVAGRYAPEFDAIGNNRGAMNELAKRTGGQVIEPNQIAPIQFHLPLHEISLVTFLSAVAAALMAAALVLWKVGLQRRRAIVITRDAA